MKLKKSAPAAPKTTLAVTPEELYALRLAVPAAAVGKRRALQALRGLDAKKVGLAVGGAMAVTALVNTAGRYQFYRRIVSGELKRQLAAVNKKLDALEEQNEALRAELAQLRKAK